jgi:3-isopropylmalate/(R)-2-methylmalate dehydratase large subunit
MTPRTIVDKIWDDHEILVDPVSEESLLYVDNLFLTDSSSFHAFDQLEKEGFTVRRPKQIFGVPDHFASSMSRKVLDITDPDRAARIEDLEKYCKKWGINHFGLEDPRMGITHVVGPEQGITQPGKIVLCGDSHTSTHGGLGALAFGIGGQSGHVLATQCLWQKKLKQMRVTVAGKRQPLITAKDIVLSIVSTIGAGGAFGHTIEYAGETITSLSVEERLTVCNMTIEAGGRAGIIAPDQATFDYLNGREFAPKGMTWNKVLEYWKNLPTDPGAVFDTEIVLDAENIEPMVSWGNTAEETLPISGFIPDPALVEDADRRESLKRALDYMGLNPGMKMIDIEIDQVFIGSCTNGRLEDLRAAAQIVKGYKAAVPALNTPGSNLVRATAEAEGLDQIFKDAGFKWGEAGCSMCVGMNGDVVGANKRCASTSNRNFVGRQGAGSRTHLLSPVMAAAAAITGRLTDVRELTKNMEFI